MRGISDWSQKVKNERIITPKLLEQTLDFLELQSEGTSSI